MKTFSYTIKDSVGLHARPAGMLIKIASKYSSDIKISCGDKTADAKKLFSVMGIGAKCGTEVTVSAVGEDEEDASAELLEFFKRNL